MMINKKLGNEFEKNFCEMLAKEGFWVHNFAQNQAGQPADIIAVRNGKAYLIDCKVCSYGVFALSRIEENQNLSMTLWKECGNGDGAFAILLEDGAVRMMPYLFLKTLKKTNHSVLSARQIYAWSYSLHEWIDKL